MSYTTCFWSNLLCRNSNQKTLPSTNTTCYFSFFVHFWMLFGLTDFCLSYNIIRIYSCISIYFPSKCHNVPLEMYMTEKSVLKISRKTSIQYFIFHNDQNSWKYQGPFSQIFFPSSQTGLEYHLHAKAG